MVTSAIIHYYPFTSTQKQTNIIPPNLLPIAGFIASEPTIGEIRYNRAIGAHPTASVDLFLAGTATQTPDQLLTQKKQQYETGTEIELFGTQFIVSRQVTRRLSLRNVITRQVILTLELEGKWAPFGNTRRQPLDEPYQILNTNTSTLTEILALAGVQYIGPEVQVFFQGNSLTNIVVPRAELESNAITAKGFVFYSNPLGVEIREWGNTPVRQLPLGIVLNQEVLESEPGFGTTVDGIKLSSEFRNTQYVPPRIIGNTGVETTIEYENATNVSEFNAPLYDGPSWVIFGPAAIEPFRNGNNAFDNSSQVKKQRIVQSKNGVVIKSSETIKGWEYITPSFYTITADEITWDPPNIQVVNGFWKTVEVSNSIRHFNGDGYWIGTDVTGNRRARYKQETAIEASQAQQGVEAGNLTPASVSAYQFFNLPINGQTLVTLDDKGDFYNDVKPGDDGVQPKFATRVTVTDLNIVRQPDPDATDENPLPEMITGRDFFEETAVNILSPKDSTSPQSPEKYRQFRYTRNSQGQGFGRYAKRGDSREIYGRPPNAERLVELSGDYQIPTGDLVGGTSYLLLSQGADITQAENVERSSVNYPNVFTQQDLLEVAQTDLSQRNLQARRISLSLNEVLPWEEGDKVNLDGREYVLEGVSLTVKPDRSKGVTRLINQGFNVTLGSLLFPSVQLYLINAQKEIELLGQI